MVSLGSLLVLNLTCRMEHMFAIKRSSVSLVFFLFRVEDMTRYLKPNGVCVINCSWAIQDLEAQLPAKMRRDLAVKKARQVDGGLETHLDLGGAAVVVLSVLSFCWLDKAGVFWLSLLLNKHLDFSVQFVFCKKSRASLEQAGISCFFVGACGTFNKWDPKRTRLRCVYVHVCAAVSFVLLGSTQPVKPEADLYLFVVARKFCLTPS